MPTAGGTPTRVTYGTGAVKLEGWTRDGNGLIVVVADAASPNGEPTLATIAVRGGGGGGALGDVRPLPFARAHGGTEDQMGCYVFYEMKQSSATKRYEGGEQSRLWRWCDGDEEAKCLWPETFRRVLYTGSHTTASAW